MLSVYTNIQLVIWMKNILKSKSSLVVKISNEKQQSFLLRFANKTNTQNET